MSQRTRHQKGRSATVAGHVVGGSVLTFAYLGFLVPSHQPTGFAEDMQTVWRCNDCHRILLGLSGTDGLVERNSTVVAPAGCPCLNGPGHSEDTPSP